MSERIKSAYNVFRFVYDVLQDRKYPWYDWYFFQQWLKKALDKQVKSEPEFLILDEPMNGLDPDGIFTLEELLKKKKEDGVTILISSHLLLELQELADEFIFLKEGEVVKVCENDVNIEDVYNEIYKNREKSL